MDTGCRSPKYLSPPCHVCEMFTFQHYNWQQAFWSVSILAIYLSPWLCLNPLLNQSLLISFSPDPEGSSVHISFITLWVSHPTWIYRLCMRLLDEILAIWVSWNRKIYSDNPGGHRMGWPILQFWHSRTGPPCCTTTTGLQHGICGPSRSGFATRGRETYICARSLGSFLIYSLPGTTHRWGNERLLIQPPPWWPSWAICEYLQCRFSNYVVLPMESFNTLKQFRKWVDLCPMQCSEKFRFLWKLTSNFYSWYWTVWDEAREHWKVSWFWSYYQKQGIRERSTVRSW